ncbi:hypothetical protein AMK11_34605 [Streptomyces sp. CB02414]|nr:hypothetical protein AMK11_34605 [Streptomyces sp. CB02414]
MIQLEALPSLGAGDGAQGQAEEGVGPVDELAAVGGVRPDQSYLWESRMTVTERGFFPSHSRTCWCSWSRRCVTIPAAAQRWKYA